MVICSKCGKRVSRGTKTCRSCGAGPKKKRSVVASAGRVLGIVVLLMLGLAVLGSIVDDDPTTQNGNEASARNGTGAESGPPDYPVEPETNRESANSLDRADSLAEWSDSAEKRHEEQLAAYEVEIPVLRQLYDEMRGFCETAEFRYWGLSAEGPFNKWDEARMKARSEAKHLQISASLHYLDSIAKDYVRGEPSESTLLLIRDVESVIATGEFSE